MPVRLRLTWKLVSAAAHGRFLLPPLRDGTGCDAKKVALQSLQICISLAEAHHHIIINVHTIMQTQTPVPTATTEWFHACYVVHNPVFFHYLERNSRCVGSSFGALPTCQSLGARGRTSLTAGSSKA